MLRSIGLLGVLGFLVMALPVEAQEEPAAIPASEVPTLSELDQPATSIEEWMTQVAQAAVVQITVRVEATETGLAIVLSTESGSIEVPATSTIGNALIADIPSAAIAAEDEEAIEIVVTDDEYEGYNPSNATRATRTDTPLRDIPQSITVVPREVLDDRNVRTVTEAVETVPGVVEGLFSMVRLE
ncbi:MAG: hypothetical protein HC895_26915 [Leptolyngbyaceae cyanobacterium SM1_3_5]|nr:hypothetical protein [Leptolyngbyaceae cyanobacterium SM1_3_5]